MSLAELIVGAYKVKKFQIAGLPGWGDSGHDLYDVEAKAADNFTPTPDEARLMLQTLLADRFQLRIHHESRLLPVYALVVSKKGLKLLADQKTCPAVPGAGTVISPAKPRSDAGGTSDDPSEPPLPWAFYAEELSIFTDRPVIDESGLDGAGYCTADGMIPLLSILLETCTRDGAGSSIYTAVEEKWGMKLEPKKVQVDVLVIDAVERPSPN